MLPANEVCRPKFEGSKFMCLDLKQVRKKRVLVYVLCQKAVLVEKPRETDSVNQEVTVELRFSLSL